MHALMSFAEHVIVDGNDLLLSYACSFMGLLECEVLQERSIGAPYRGINFLFSVCFEFLKYWDRVFGFTNPSWHSCRLLH